MPSVFWLVFFVRALGYIIYIISFISLGLNFFGYFFFNYMNKIEWRFWNERNLVVLDCYNQSEKQSKKDLELKKQVKCPSSLIE